ncbi:hypothetical protein [Laceyella putida]|uniref:HNH endonuclease n=1 Tax=Laceyella putida TaxID=110101 RepID=A0ABW2RRA5_9BACL
MSRPESYAICRICLAPLWNEEYVCEEHAEHREYYRKLEEERMAPVHKRVEERRKELNARFSKGK